MGEPQFASLSPDSGDTEWDLLAKLVLLFGGTPASADTAQGLLSQLVSLANGGSGGGVSLNAENLTTDHSYQGITLGNATVLGSPLNFGDVLTEESDGGWVEWTFASAAPARGICVADSSGGVTTVLFTGLVRDDSFSFTPGETLYATESGISGTPPSASGEIVQQIGFALSADIAFIDMNSTFLTLA